MGPRSLLCVVLFLALAVLIYRRETAIAFGYTFIASDNFGYADFSRKRPAALCGDQEIRRNKEQTADISAPLLQRMSRYFGRYDYRPAAPKTAQISTPNNIDVRNISAICGDYPTFAPWYRRNPLSNQEGRSVNNEDRTMFEAFYRQLGPGFKGTFVEMGAFNGIVESNSLFFETCLGWEGILIEANPQPYPLLVQNRPYSHRLHYAPSCNATAEANNVTIPFYNSAFTNAGQANDDVKSAYSNIWVKGEPVQVPCGTLTDVFRDLLPGGRVTFMSLDVEGAEPLVIGNAIDFGAVFIEVLMAEQFNQLCPAPPGYCESREKVRVMMKENGYILYDKLVQKSDVYVHPLSKFRANSPVAANWTIAGI